jgi:hypothetical protein
MNYGIELERLLMGACLWGEGRGVATGVEEGFIFLV